MRRTWDYSWLLKHSSFNNRPINFWILSTRNVLKFLVSRWSKLRRRGRRRRLTTIQLIQWENGHAMWARHPACLGHSRLVASYCWRRQHDSLWTPRHNEPRWGNASVLLQAPRLRSWIYAQLHCSAMQCRFCAPIHGPNVSPHWFLCRFGLRLTMQRCASLLYNLVGTRRN